MTNAQFISFNGEICRRDEAKIRAVSSSALYGKGVFTTLAIYAGKPFLFGEHCRRLKMHAAKIGLDVDLIDENALQHSLSELISVNILQDGRARISIFDESSPAIWQTKENSPNKISTLITTAEFRPVADELPLTVSPFRVNSGSPLVGVKSLNYLENLLAFEEAKKRGFDEAVRLNESGEIVSACLANIFWLKKGEIFTPSLKTGALEGTMRNLVCRTAAENSLKILETVGGIEEIKTADAIFITSAGLGLRMVRKFEAKTLALNEIVLNLKRAIEKRTEGMR